MTSSLAADIDRFLRDTAMPETLFGRRAAKDPRLVGDMRRGRRIGDSLRQRIETFMREHGGLEQRI
ncbi:MAG: hypothetical protein OSB00_06080 [Sphingomonas bacterium]|nr:hypothetical protein [Sphingomonas bacterium]